jgi:hypothetical protein
MLMGPAFLHTRVQFLPPTTHDQPTLSQITDRVEMSGSGAVGCDPNLVLSLLRPPVSPFSSSPRLHADSVVGSDDIYTEAVG